MICGASINLRICDKQGASPAADQDVWAAVDLASAVDSDSVSVGVPPPGTRVVPRRKFGPSWIDANAHNVKDGLEFGWPNPAQVSCQGKLMASAGLLQSIATSNAASPLEF